MGRLSRSGLVLGVAGLLIVGGSAYALGASGSGTITVCVRHNGGALYKAGKCAKHDRKLTWDKQGRMSRSPWNLVVAVRGECQATRIGASSIVVCRSAARCRAMSCSTAIASLARPA
jgi:hypothetical protein